MDGPLGKTKYSALRVEFQERGSPHVHAFIWILNAPKIGNETEYIAFTEKKSISAHLPDPVEQPELFELVKLYQIHSHARTSWKYKKNKCRFSSGRFFTDRTIISKPLNSDIPQDERDKIMSWQINIRGFLTNELRVTIYCTSYELLFTYELLVITYCTSYELVFTYVLRVTIYCTSYELNKIKLNHNQLFFHV